MNGRIFYAAALLAILPVAARADLIVRKDGSVLEGKVLSRDSRAMSVQIDTPRTMTISLPADSVAKVIVVDDHGSEVAEAAGTATPGKRPDPHWELPKEPEAPPVPAAAKGSTYYVIPLHGEVGVTYLADNLEKSFADAVKRSPTVVVLDIDSPGGLVAEAEQMVKAIHKYNKQLRIVALADQDLSASAITTLSAKTIYMKSTGNIGAATAFNMSDNGTPKDIQEKMQSVWRAVARNSAEEGGHEPLLAEAMIDSSKDLHLETAGGQKVIKEGIGPKMIVTRGKILTLTSHEAVDCGLAAGIADDFDELGEEMKMKGWSEAKGLGTLLADFIPTKRAAYEKQSKQLEESFRQNLKDADGTVPSENVVTQQLITSAPGFGGAPASSVNRGGRAAPGVPQLPAGMGGFGGAGGFGSPARGARGPQQMNVQQPQQRIVTQLVKVVTPEQRAKWRDNSLKTVVSLLIAEQCLQDGVVLANAYGVKSDTDELNQVITLFDDARAKIYADRDKYASDSLVPTVAIAATSSTPARAATATLVPTPASNKPPASATPAANSAYADTLPDGAVKTAIVGGPGGIAFNRVDAAARTMVGVKCTLGTWSHPIIGRIEPVYDGVPGASRDGLTVVAKDGYVVGGIDVAASDNVDAVRVRFMREKDGKIIMSDAYNSDWIGNGGDHSGAKKLAGNGDRVIGICGRQGMNQDAMGLIVIPAGPPTPADAH